MNNLNWGYKNRSPVQ